MMGRVAGPGAATVAGAEKFGKDGGTAGARAPVTADGEVVRALEEEKPRAAVRRPRCCCGCGSVTQSAPGGGRERCCCGPTEAAGEAQRDVSELLLLSLMLLMLLAAVPPVTRPAPATTAPADPPRAGHAERNVAGVGDATTLLLPPCCGGVPGRSDEAPLSPGRPMPRAAAAEPEEEEAEIAGLRYIMMRQQVRRGRSRARVRHFSGAAQGSYYYLCDASAAALSSG